ncbi:dephospho-CoA kinase [Aliidiomarina shirensis]|uniref:Dephospho-CoA kinase n=1 Tax=Aliidiomarina shirensis TaxID=1048642 RepID=A0A432WUT8_9GAMM|nr:dephospho-CoA kinase [Aliidiomarina shirensis]RUO37532.1 dephospho-CoA kinase [Aliidiomarina shirensis]
MIVIGITGGIGSGKTTVTNLFQELGIAVVDADVIAREVIAPGSPLLTTIADHFADHYNLDILDASGQLVRARLREIIFADSAAKEWLNAQMHPAIRDEILHQLEAATSPYVMLSAPLLLENGLDKLCQRVLVVDIPEALQLKRTQQRDSVAQSQIEAIIAAQMSREERLKRADDVIDNSGDTSALAPKVQQLHAQYLALS